MANLKSVQKGIFTLATDKASDTFTISEVDLEKTILFKGGVRIDNEGEWPSYANIMVSLTDSTTITFERIEANGVEAKISWYVVEFGAGVRVQHAIEEFDREDTQTVEITEIADIDLSKSFCLISYKTNGHRFGADDFCRARVLEESGQKKIEMSFGTSTRGAVSWQVVEIENDSDVQNGLVNLAGNKASINKTISNFDLTKSFLIFSYRVSGESKPYALAIRGFLSDPNKLTFERSSSSSGISAEISWFVVQMTDGTSVQQQDVALAAGDNKGNTTIDPVTIENTSVHISSLEQFGKNELSSADEFGKAMITVDLDETDKVLHERGQANSAAGIWTFYAIEWAKKLNNENGGEPMGFLFFDNVSTFIRGVRKPQRKRELLEEAGVDLMDVLDPTIEADIDADGDLTEQEKADKKEESKGIHIIINERLPAPPSPLPDPEPEILKFGTFISAQISKKGGSDDDTTVEIALDDNVVARMNFKKAAQLGLKNINNSFGIILNEGDHGVMTLSFGYTVPLFFESRIQVFVHIKEPNVSKIEATAVWGTEGEGQGDPPGSPGGGEGDFP